MTACPVDAIRISPVGAKVVEADQCVGCKLCTIACPYGTIFLDTERKKAIKCDLCGGHPACAHACPTSAIEWAETAPQDWLGDFAAGRSAYNLTGLAATP
jgi:Fe-S-cluster-containing hydrogenase component 2